MHTPVTNFITSFCVSLILFLYKRGKLLKILVTFVIATMNNASLYSQCNHLQIRDAEEIIEKFNDFRPPSRNSLKLLDIGCGDGEVLVKVLKMLKVQVEKAIGIDISSKMIEHSRKNHENQSIMFHCVNVFRDSLEGNIFMQNNLQSFEIVTCFFCLHWIENLR